MDWPPGMSDAEWERMESDPAWAEEWEKESSEWGKERSEEGVDDRWIGAAGAASSSSGARR